MQRWKLAAIGVFSVVVAITLAPLSAANAQSVPEVGLHCAVEIQPIGSAETLTEPVCFGTEEEVIAHIGSIGVGNGARGAAANTIVGTVYRDADSGGQSLTFWGTSGCAGVTFGFPTLPSGWDTSISSVRATNGCWVTLYTAANYGGSRLNCTPYCASIGGDLSSVTGIRTDRGDSTIAAGQGDSGGPGYMLSNENGVIKRSAAAIISAGPNAQQGGCPGLVANRLCGSSVLAGETWRFTNTSNWELAIIP